MKCLTLHQPWAQLIIHGPKRIENRNWPTDYRGPLLIHAGKSRKSLASAGMGLGRYAREAIDRLPPENELPFGAIIGRVYLSDCVPVSQVRGQPFAEGPWCWLLDEPEAFRPYLIGGQQGLWEVSAFDYVKLVPERSERSEIQLG